MGVLKKEITSINITKETKDRGVKLANKLLETNSLSSIVAFLINKEYNKTFKN